MNTTTAVDVFLGHPLVDDTEKHFLQRLRRDLMLRGIPALVLANFVAPPKYRQIDFLIVTASRTVLCELKGYIVPVVGRSNGRWQRVLSGTAVDTDGNAFRQAQDQVYGLSDAMRQYAETSGAPSPRKRSYYQDIDTLVCCFPSIPNGSRFDRFPFVSVVGYDELLARLQQPGPSLPWTQDRWNGFVRHLGLYRDEEDHASIRELRVQNSIVDEYCARFAQAARAASRPLVPTSVIVDGQPTNRPTLPALLAQGRHVLLRGTSGAGKSLWARATALEAADAGHVPIWIQAGASEESFRTSLSRAVAPFTTQTAEQLLAAAEATGRAVILLVDGLNEAPAVVRASLLAGTQALALRGTARGVLLTSQVRPDDVHDVVDVELVALDPCERYAILQTYGAAQIVNSVEAFTTPLELSLAAACAEDLPKDAHVAQLMDAYIYRTVPSETVRAGLRAIAWQMHDQIRWSLPAPEGIRMLRRDLALDSDTAELVLASRLLTVSQGRVRFVHERFAVFLATEQILVANNDPATAARLLNEPRHLALRADAVALESDENRLGTLLSTLADPDVLTLAACGKLGEPAERVGHLVLDDALRTACARTATEDARFEFEANSGFGGSWVMQNTMTQAELAQLVAIGSCVRRGAFISGVSALLATTDERCTEIEKTHGPGVRNRLVAATYAIGGASDTTGLPASVVVRACARSGRLAPGTPESWTESAVKLLARNPQPGAGVLILTTDLLRPVTKIGARYVPDVAVACLSDGAYHLRLAGLQLIEQAAAQLRPEERELVAATVGEMETDNIFLNSSITDTLAALGELSPVRTLDDIAEEIRDVLARPDDPLARSRACGIISSQFENDVIGPYFEAIEQLSPSDRSHLIALALYASDPDGFSVPWMIEDISNLDDPQVASAIINLIARADPCSWYSTQTAMAVVVGSVRLLARSDHDLPALASPDPAWGAFLELLLVSLRQADGRATPNEVDAAWQRILAERDALPDLLTRLVDARIVSTDRVVDVETLLADARREELSAVLVCALEYPDTLRSPFRWSHDRTRSIIQLLGRVGTHQASPVLRRFANDAELATIALAAVREIETRTT